MSGRVSALEVVASGTTPCCLKLGATTCSMKPLAAPSGKRLLGTCDHTPGTGGCVECMEVSQLTHVAFVTPWERIPSARRQKTKDIEGRARNFSKLLKTSKPSKSSKLSQVR